MLDAGRTAMLLGVTLLLGAGLSAAPGGDVLASNKPRETKPAASDADLALVADGNLAFAMDLYRRQPPGTNLFYSPYSISTALAMLSAGARGDTATQIASTLHYNLPDWRLHPVLNRVDLSLAERAKPQRDAQQAFKLNVANAIWGQKGYDFAQAYLDLLATNYGAGLRTLDFAGAPEAARQTINDTVAQQTADRIKDLLPPKSIAADTKLVLTNAIYFLAPWSEQFSKAATADGPFTQLDGTPKQVPMMHHTGFYRQARGETWQAVELAYADGHMSMVVLMATPGRFQDFEKSVDAVLWKTVLGELRGARVALTFPKFTTRYSRSLSDDLMALGMHNAFDAAKADFSGIDGRRDLLVSDVVHQAFVKVDEDGTEAAAATAVMMAPTSVASGPLHISVDRPFVFMIRDRPTGMVLFMGRIVDPA